MTLQQERQTFGRSSEKSEKRQSGEVALLLRQLTVSNTETHAARNNDERRAEDLSRRLAPLERQLCVDEVEVESLRADVARAHNEAAASNLHAQVQQTHACAEHLYLSSTCRAWHLACGSSMLGQQLWGNAFSQQIPRHAIVGQ